MLLSVARRRQKVLPFESREHTCRIMSVSAIEILLRQQTLHVLALNQRCIEVYDKL